MTLIFDRDVTTRLLVKLRLYCSLHIVLGTVSFRCTFIILHVSIFHNVGLADLSFPKYTVPLTFAFLT